MNLSLKAVLLSAFVIPGSGHILLKRHRAGGMLIVIALSALTVLLLHAYEAASSITDKILNGEIPFDVTLLAQQIKQQSMASDSFSTWLASLALILAWAFGIVDSYRVGSKMTHTGKQPV